LLVCQIQQRRRHELARLPIEKKLLAVVRLQELAAPSFGSGARPSAAGAPSIFQW
jgi:hypothetical protein